MITSSFHRLGFCIKLSELAQKVRQLTRIGNIVLKTKPCQIQAKSIEGHVTMGSLHDTVTWYKTRHAG